MENKISDMVENLLRVDPRTRDSDKFLIWAIMYQYGIKIPYDKFMELPSFESITRCRRKLQEKNTELAANFNVIQVRNEQMNMFKRNINKEEVIINERF